MPDLVKATQAQLDFRLKSNGIPLRFCLVDHLPKAIEPLMEKRPIPGTYATSTIEESDDNSVLTKEVYDDLRNGKNDNGNGNGNGSGNGSITNPQSYSEASAIRSIELHFHDFPHMWVDLYEAEAILAYNLDQTHRNDVPFFVTQALYDALLEPDIQMWELVQNDYKSKNRSFPDYKKEINVNFVAVEDSSDSPWDILLNIERFMARYKMLEPFVNIKVGIEVLDVSKRRAASHLIKNTTSSISFFYLTTLKGYVNSVQGVPLHHISPEDPPKEVPQDSYGTAYQAYEKRLNTVVYNISDFMGDASREIAKLVGLPSSSTPNLRLKTASALKHHTLMGIRDTLDILLDPELFSESHFHRVCLMVDSLIVNQRHEWLKHLEEIYTIFQDLQNSKKKSQLS